MKHGGKVAADDNPTTLRMPNRFVAGNSNNIFVAVQGLSEEEKVVYLDFSAVESLDSTGLGELLKINEYLTDRDKSLKLINVSQDMFKILKIVCFDQLIDIGSAQNGSP